MIRFRTLSHRSPAAQAVGRLGAAAATAALLAGGFATAPGLAAAQTVLAGDPIDGGSGQAWPIMPELPLLLPGPDEDFGTGDDIINLGIVGDVDLAIRVGTIVGATVPAPAGAGGGPSLSTVTAGGGSSGQGAEVDFSVLVSDGSGSPPYGNVITSSDLDLRPVTIFAFADLDGDGVIGPTNADGSADNALERQEATAYVGRQVDAFVSGRVLGSLGIQSAAPASIGGLSVVLVAGAYTGSSAVDMFSDGPPIYTLWPFFPPLDPKRVFGKNAPAPDPDVPSEVGFDIERNYLPAPGHPTLGTPFAIPTDGSSPTTDQLIVVSGDAIGVRLFADADAAGFRAGKRLALRVAPDGAGRVLVLPADRIALAADGDATTHSLRLLPVDLLGNVADVAPAGITVTLEAEGGVGIVSPDTDTDPTTETIDITDAEGALIELDDTGSAAGRVTVKVAEQIFHVTEAVIGAGVDSDGDGIDDDGDGSGIVGDNPCTADDAPFASCDDNCPTVGNADQEDEDADGSGNCCDGACITDPTNDGCGICVLEAAVDALDRVKLKATLATAPAAESVVVKVDFTLGAAATIDPSTETVRLVLNQGGLERYVVQLSGAYDSLGGSRGKYAYADADASVAGVTKSQIKERSGRRWRASWKAKAADIVDLDSSAIDVVLEIGTRTMQLATSCDGNASKVRCSGG